MSLHLLSLPTETLDTVISFIVHPIDAYNLSLTCKYLHTHLMSQSNRFWYNLVRKYVWGRMYDWPYDPKRDYFEWVKRSYLNFGACHLCLAHASVPERRWLEGMGVGEESLKSLGMRVCVACFVEHTVCEFSPLKR